MTPEGEVKSKITGYLCELEDRYHLPLYHELRQAGGFAYKKGLPDLFAVFNGRHIEIEVKRPGGQQSTMQQHYERYFKNLNIEYILSDSIEDFKQKFTNLMEKYS